MEDFDTLMKQAVSIKTNQMVQKRKKFEALPLFLKAGLYYLAKFANVRKQGFYQRYAVCDHLKGRGTKLFKEEKADLAAREYEQALSLLRYINNKNPNWKNEGIIDEDLEYINFDGEGEEEKAMSTNIKVALYNNLAACYLSLNDLQNAKAACDEALILDPTQAKAWFRRAKALTSDVNSGLSEYKAAIEDLKKALELSPEDPVIQQALNKIKHDMIKVKNSGQSFKGIFQGKNEKKLSEDSSIEKTSTAGSIKDAQTSPNQREEQKEKSPPTQEAVKSVREETIQTKKEKVRDNEEKKEPNMKEAPKKSAPPNSVKTASDNKIEKNNDVWKMLHGDKDPNSNDYDYSLSYGAKENAEVPQEIAELEKFLEKRGNDLLRFYESSGKTQQAQELRENLRKAMAAKQRLEKIATLDFDKPNSQLKEVADKFGLDLNDPDIKDELKKIQSQNLDDIRNWINGMGPETDTGSNGVKSKKSSDKNRIGENLSSGNMTTTNNYYINNNYYSSGGDSKTKMMKDQKDHDLVDDVTKLKETESSSKVTRIMNLVIIAVAVGLFLVSLIMQTNRATVTKEM